MERIREPLGRRPGGVPGMIFIPPKPLIWLPRLDLGPRRMSPGYPCCCGADCEHCSGGASSQWQVVTSGIGNDGCGDCDPDLNDTWILDQDLDHATIGCVYSYTLPEAICDIDFIYGFYHHDGAGYYWGVVFRQGVGLGLTHFSFNGPAGWRQAGKPACAFNNESLTRKTETSSDCDLSGATCLVTAIP